jgi:hypothetical protein
MRRGNVDLVLEAVGCFERKDWDGLSVLIAPDAVMTPLEIWPDPGPFIGVEASIREYKRLVEVAGRIDISVSDVVSHEAWVVGHYRNLSDESVDGAPVGEFTGVHRFEDRQFAESHYRFDRNAALAAAGL